MKITYKILPSYDHLIDAPRNIHYPKKDIRIENAPDEIRSITLECYKQVERLSKHLYHNDVYQFSYNILDWCLSNFTYKEDDPDVDQYREPARAWADKHIDCDCFTIFIDSLLLCAGVSCQSVMVGCNGADYHHIYAAIGCKQTASGGVTGGIIIDPVMKERNIYRHPENITKSKITNMVFERLSGAGDRTGKYYKGLGGLTALISPATQKLIDNRSRIISNATSGKTNVKAKLNAVKPYLHELSKLNFCIALNGNPEEQGIYLSLYPALSHITPSGDIIIKSDRELLQTLGKYLGCELSYYFGNDLDGLGSLSSKLKKLKDKIESSAKKLVNTVEAAGKDVANAVGDAAKKLAQAAEASAKKALQETTDLAKKAIHLIAKIFPVTLLARNAYLLVLNLNLFNHARILSIGTGTEGEAKSRGYSSSGYIKIKTQVERAKELWDKLGGEEEHLVTAINNGKNKKPLFGIKGSNPNVSGLGVVIDTATITAASGIIAGISSLFKSVQDLFKKEDSPSDGKDTPSSFPHTNPDGSITLNSDGDVQYSDGDIFKAKPADGKPYILKKDGTRIYDQSVINQEKLDQKPAEDFLKSQGESTGNNTIWYVGAAAAAAGLLFFTLK